MKGICINQDTQDLIGRTGRDRPSLEEIKNFPKIYEGTHVTDYFINMIDTCATFPSKTRTSFLDKYYQKVENGIPVDYSGCNCCKGMHYTYEELGIDYIDLHIKGFREIGINPWLTYRMNDYHSRNEATSELFSDFYHEHPEVRNGRNIPKNLWGWDGYAYDFKFDIVRAHELDIINESLERYDPYGIELDFQREMACFALGEEYEGIEVMNGFMRDVDAVVKKAEERWGHKIKIAVRVMPEINYCFEYGFDVMKWVQEGIVDTVVISARWASSDTDMPIAMWKTLLSPYGAELFAGYEYWIQSCGHAERLRPNIDVYTAYAANAFSQGADKFYLYNYYTSFNTVLDRDGEYDFDPTHVPGDPAQYRTIINHLGDPEKILTMNRRHLILIKDRLPRWRGSEHIGDGEARGVSQLPLRFEYSGCFRLMVGDIAEGATVTLRFSVDDLELALANIPRLFVNSVECDYIGNEKDERFTPHPLLCYNIPREALKTNITALISTTKLITTRYVDVFVKVRD
ncbi:MAG: hypothetical protein IJY93_10190 [Clostridia bacterium]|nr:hypothetical protein [Clostridia bacterium]